ncbi:hypothetical protein JXR93_04890, partial [bacterium]|nr:hypothetical protein [bacterium]
MPEITYSIVGISLTYLIISAIVFHRDEKIGRLNLFLTLFMTIIYTLPTTFLISSTTISSIYFSLKYNMEYFITTIFIILYIINIMFVVKVFNNNLNRLISFRADKKNIIKTVFKTDNLSDNRAVFQIISFITLIASIIVSVIVIKKYFDTDAIKLFIFEYYHNDFYPDRATIEAIFFETTLISFIVQPIIFILIFLLMKSLKNH